MYNVCVDRVYPYVEELWYEFDNLQEAKEYAEETSTLVGVHATYVYDEDDTMIETYHYKKS